MGKKNTNFRKLYLVDEDHYNSLQYGQVHDKHLKEVKALYETTNRPQPPPIQNGPLPTQNVPPPTQNGPPQQPDEPMDVDPIVNYPQQNMLNASTQTLRTNNPVPFLGFVPPPQRTPLGTAIQRLAGPQIPDLGPPLQPRLPQTQLQAARSVGPSPSQEPKVELPPSPAPGAPLSLPAPAASLALTAPYASLALAAPAGPYALPPLPPPPPPRPYALPPLPPPAPPGVFALPAPTAPLPLPAPAAPLPLPAPAARLPLPAPAAPLPLPAPAAPLPLPAPTGMDVDPSRGTRRPRSPDTVGDNGSPIIGRPGQRRRYQRVINPEPFSAPISPIRSRTPQPTVANDSQELGARRRTYQRVIINPDEDFLRQNSRDTQQQRPEIVWFKCSICKNNFRSEQTLRKHQQRVHKEYFEQSERGEKRERGNQEYGRNNPKNKRIA